ncbi:MULTISPECIES: virion morphogenesis protein [unclassified Pseudodesulfovibrio]|uniref:virion morphogenesis protein n=1 Tax=unclassified Pseudodesulfovibrio TaxID=2661612 RepID=UPI000FEC03A1|nr:MULTISPECIES: virion morphogenesis protein [unclassified Pseudodesulfovibrio]MCJ2164652.1 virion morphogenesis protein [Pseudodesulfovibrio sp. S3-i]RWU04156.1 virion morphogenesis protein [Pseudodesulfovibrio sp. S3]
MSKNSPVLKLNTDPDGRLRLREQLALVALPRRTRRNITMRMGREIIKEAKTNIRQQRTTYGRSMEGRKDTRKRRKLLRGFGRGLKPFMRGSDRVDVTWSNSMTAQLADRHQNGIAEQWTASKARKVYGVPDYSKPATREQAKALKAEGYKLRVKKSRGKGHTLRRVPIKWITENLSRGQAGAILRQMRDGKKRGKQSWEVKPAARPFLGPKPGTEEKFLNDLARQTMAEIGNR